MVNDNNIQGLRQSFTRDEYVSPAIFAHEMEEIFAKRWNFVGRAEQLAHIGGVAPLAQLFINRFNVVVPLSIDQR